MSTKRKVGDKVRIRRDLVPHKWYGEDNTTTEMANCRGRKAQIAYIARDGRGYLLNIEGKDDSYGVWTDQMLEP